LQSEIGYRSPQHNSGEIIMTLSDLASIGSLVGGLAVVITLVFLSIQTRQTNKNQRSMMQQGQTNRVASSLLAMATTEMAAAWIKGNGGVPTPEAITSLQVTQVCNVLVYDMLDYHNQHSDGLMGDEMFRASEVSYSAFLQQPAMRAYWASWRAQRTGAAPMFIAWVDSLAANPVVGGNPNWN
jgi:hypothetical protein